MTDGQFSFSGVLNCQYVLFINKNSLYYWAFREEALKSFQTVLLLWTNGRCEIGGPSFSFAKSMKTKLMTLLVVNRKN